MLLVETELESKKCCFYNGDIQIKGEGITAVGSYTNGGCFAVFIETEW